MKPSDPFSLSEGCAAYVRTPSVGVSIMRGGGGLNYGYLPSRHGSRVRELANGLRLGAVVLSQNLSGV
jgi:hypothetical protein